MAGCGLLLLAAVILQFVHRLSEVPESVNRTRLAEVLPRELPGWCVSDPLLGTTEHGTAGALKQLNVDDFVYRRFASPGKTFSVYAAHWPRGRMPTRLVASHTPDRCWTENGMRCVAMQFRQRYVLAGHALPPAETRTFAWPDGSERTHVAYWHMVERQTYDYGARFNAVPNPWRWWKDTIAQAAYGSREQLFVRITSEQPLDELWRDADFLSVMIAVEKMGL